MVDILIGNVTLDNLLIFIFIFLITAVAGKAIRRKLDEKGVLIDRLLGIILVLAAIYFFLLALN